MIKLKDILKESSKVQLHKIITAKDEPSFMTEEQWEKKWTTINESEKQLEELSERLVINESILEGVDHAWYKKPVYQGVMRKGIIKFVNSLTPNSRSAKLLNKYFEKGKISDREATMVMQDWYKATKKVATGATAVLMGLMYRSGLISGAHFLAFPIINAIMKVIVVTGLTSILPKSEKSMTMLGDRFRKAGDYLEKRQDDTPEEKALVDKTNKQIKNIKQKKSLFNIR